MNKEWSKLLPIDRLAIIVFVMLALIISYELAKSHTF